MKPLTFEEVVSALEGVPDRPVPPGSIRRVTTDSRTVESGDLFVAIRGDRFDGHDFVGRAFAAGAAAAVVRDDFDAPVVGEAHGAEFLSPGALLIRVPDPVAAMGRLARFYRRSVIGPSATVVAVTGSNGKTTTKAMIDHLLSGRRHGRSSIRSFNNAIGVPLTLLSAEPSDVYVICEVGTNAPGEIAALAHLIEPDVAVVTGVSAAHLEGLGTVEKVAEEKLSLLRHLRPDGCAIVNGDQELLRRVLDRDPHLRRIRRVTFGAWSEADLRLTEVQPIPGSGRADDRPEAHPTTDAHPVDDARPARDGHAANGWCPGMAFRVNNRFAYRLGVPGRHNVMNALAAIAVARRFNMDHAEIAERLATFTLPDMRLQFERAGTLTLINDAYNANPASVAAAVDVLTQIAASGRRVLIVGDMRELGDASESLHREVAERIGTSPIDMVVAVGEYAKMVARTIRIASRGRAEVHAHGSTATARRRLAGYLKPDDTVLIKGSRALGMEVLVKRIRSVAGQWEAVGC